MPLDAPLAAPVRFPGSANRARWPTRRVGALALGATAALLGSMAVASRLLARRAERRHPPIGRFITVDGVRLHYIERGEGRPLLLLHGMGSVLQDFTSSLLDDFAREYRVVAFDRPGYGYSERPRRMYWTPTRQARLIHMAVTRLGLDPPIVLGHSWGTLVALAYALRYPQQTAAIVLLGGYLFPQPLPALEAIGIFRVPLLGALLRNTVMPIASRFVLPRLLRDVAFAPNPIPERFAREFPLELSYRPTQIRAQAEEALMLRPATAALSPHYGEVAVPTVVMAGESDRVVNARDHAIRLHRMIRHSVTRLLPRTGHMIHQAAPVRVREAVGIARSEVETAS